MRSLEKAIIETPSRRERFDSLRERAADFLGDMMEKVFLDPVDKVTDWFEDKPLAVRALGAFVLVPTMIVVEAAGGTAAVMATAAAVGPALAIPVGLAATYAWMETMVIGNVLYDEL